jgi:predicted small metal-binding protein
MPDDKDLRCDCGYEVTSENEAALLDEIRRHARDAHGITFSAEDALLVVLRSQFDLSRVPSESGSREERASGGGSS